MYLLKETNLQLNSIEVGRGEFTREGNLSRLWGGSHDPPKAMCGDKKPTSLENSWEARVGLGRVRQTGETISSFRAEEHRDP